MNDHQVCLIVDPWWTEHSRIPLAKDTIFYELGLNKTISLWTSDPFLPNQKNCDFSGHCHYFPDLLLDDMSWICLTQTVRSFQTNRNARTNCHHQRWTPTSFHPSHLVSRDTFWSELMCRDLCLFENLTHAGPEADHLRNAEKSSGRCLGKRNKKYMFSSHLRVIRFQGQKEVNLNIENQLEKQTGFQQEWQDARGLHFWQMPQNESQKCLRKAGTHIVLKDWLLSHCQMHMFLPSLVWLLICLVPKNWVVCFQISISFTFRVGEFHAVAGNSLQSCKLKIDLWILEL